MQKISPDKAPIPDTVLSSAPRDAADSLFATSYAREVEQEAPKTPFSHYLWILRRHIGKLAAFVAACSFITFLISARLQPVYESTATIDIDLQAPTSVVGPSSAAPGYSLDPDTFFATQVRLIESDVVLRPVAEEFHTIGNNPAASKSAPLDTQKNASAPISLSGLRVSRPVNTYLLYISYRCADPQLAANVANAIAQSYLNQTYQLRIRSSDKLSSFMSQQLDELKAKMEQSNQALEQFEKDMDVINPDQKTDILSSRLLQLNTEYTTAQADRIKRQALWESMKSGPAEAATMSPEGPSLQKLSDDLNQAQQQLATVQAIYGTKHPEYRKAASTLAEVKRQYDDSRSNVMHEAETAYRESSSREQMLGKAVDDTKAEWDHVNARSFQYQQLKQEATADKTLYDELIRKIREEQINVGFKDNNIRIANIARPPALPVAPNPRRNVILAFLLSVAAGLAALILLDSMDTTLRDPAEASRFLQTDVIGTLPVDHTLSTLPKAFEKKPGDAPAVVPAPNGTGNQNRPGGYRSISDFEEAVRTIRNTILLSDFERRLRSIVLTSAEPGEGKSTLAIYLALANADRGKRTLLVDGDLRRPSIHARFGMTPKEGLSNVLNGEINWRDAILAVEGRPNLSILPAGPSSHRAADLIGPYLAELLNDFAKDFDMVVLDSPPLLGFAECLQMADAADGVLVVANAGKTKRKSVAAVVSALNRVRANIIGIVLNQVSSSTSADAYSYYGGQYDDYRGKSEA
jgi:capsular exopolysaccharide synthesis family protein